MPDSHCFAKVCRLLALEENFFFQNIHYVFPGSVVSALSGRTDVSGSAPARGWSPLPPPPSTLSGRGEGFAVFPVSLAIGLQQIFWKRLSTGNACRQVLPGRSTLLPRKDMHQHRGLTAPTA
jgi:hypothetical protein